MKKGILSRLILNLIVILLLFNFLSFVIGQTSGGTDGATETVPEEKTKTGTAESDLAKEGNIGTQKQDLGGLAGIDANSGGSGGTETEGSKPGVSGNNLKFERNWEGDSKQVEIKPNQGGKTELELNGKKQGDFKDSNGALGESKINLEKGESGEVELTSGSSFKTGEQGGEYRLGENNVELPKNAEVDIKEQGDHRQIEMTVEPGSEIKQPEQTPQEEGKEKEKKDEYLWSGTWMRFQDSQGNFHDVTGDLKWSSSQGFYGDSTSKDLRIDDVILSSSNKVKSNDITQIGFGDSSLAKTASGSYAIFNGNQQLTIGSNNNNYGPTARFLGERFGSDNNFGLKFDSPQDYFAMQANPHGSATLTNRGTTSSSLEFFNGGGSVDNGPMYFSSTNNRVDFNSYSSSPQIEAVRTNIYHTGSNSNKDLTTVPIEMIPRNINQGLAGYDKSITVDSNNRYSLTKASPSPVLTPQDPVNSPVNFNHVTPKEQPLLNSLTPVQQDNFLRSPPPTRNSLALQQQPTTNPGSSGTINPTKPLIDPSKVGVAPKTSPGWQPSTNAPITRIPDTPNTPVQIPKPQTNWGSININGINWGMNDKSFGGSYNPSKHTDGVLLKFTSPGCKYCQQMKTIDSALPLGQQNRNVLESLSSQRTNIKIAEVDVTTSDGHDLYPQYGVTSLPAMIYFNSKTGLRYNLGVGYMNSNQINNAINQAQQGRLPGYR